MKHRARIEVLKAIMDECITQGTFVSVLREAALSYANDLRSEGYKQIPVDWEKFAEGIVSK